MQSGYLCRDEGLDNLSASCNQKSCRNQPSHTTSSAVLVGTTTVTETKTTNILITLNNISKISQQNCTNTCYYICCTF